MHLILLDAKSAFDMVDHKHLLSRLFHIGVTDKHWSIIESFHRNCISSVKWMSQVSSEFRVHQGVKQGGVLSTDLYKIYVNPLLDRLVDANIGSSIGSVRCSTSACADDICLCADSLIEVQGLLNISAEFANMERYLLQPKKSVHIHVNPRRKNNTHLPLILNGSELPTVKRALHLGIIRTESLLNNQKENVDENLKKARRKAYSLFGSGYQGHEGLNISSVILLYKTYVVPVLLYGLELLLPPESMINKLELFQRKFVKEILRLPDNTANPSINLITGILPIEAQIHIRALTFLHTLLMQDDNSAEKEILKRQIQIKSVNSASWFVEVQKFMWLYDLGLIEDILHDTPTKGRWKTIIHGAVNRYWLSA
ncbi:uncharacterized protein LOC128546427 [Mercenaria mercenaria]|uniref:uncharacterized protein LOC128546427 n=1 Tax=Mercenaria mercenaria TaxID=6596 RepID=UPI00234EBDB1|nr:uncharacterized protein LOC128546427 [Mercenaria mercenaria]